MVKKLIYLIFILVLSFLFTAFLDYKIGYKFLKEPKYRITKYDHDLRRHLKIFERGNILYTNNYGFKNKDGSTLKNKEIDIAFIGDSFTEGIAIKHEDTFVGIFENQTQGNVVNLGVSSYSPSIYYEKIKFYLDKGFTFKEVIVFIDISDIQDEAAYYIEDEHGYIHTRKVGTVSPLKRNLHILLSDLPLIYTAVVKIKKFLTKDIKNLFVTNKSSLDFNKPVYKKISLKQKQLSNFERYNEVLIYDYYDVKLYDFKYSRSFWTYYNDDIPYEPLGIDGGIQRSLNKMSDLYNLLKSKNIKLSVGIHPWPGQILYDQRESKQVKIWRDFCKNKCNNFFNMFNFFFDEIELMGNRKSVINKYYLDGDVHFNEAGNRAVANEILKKY
tara:strand:- start:1233 stop:2387 length:1155 start_codon:yes stop_codon:yes gene_type:complete